MHDKEVYVLTRLGESQLRSGETTVSTEEIELLVRVDGVLTIGQIKAGMQPAVPPDFDYLFSGLITKGMLERRDEDPFADQFSFKPSKSALKKVEAEADAGAQSLVKAGYFVRIAHKRPARELKGDQQLVAVVVEDEPHLQKFLEHYLTFEGFEVRTAANRDEIISALMAKPVPDLVLLDVVLPDTDGFDILGKMRAHSALKSVPVIMLTAKATRESVIQGLAGGAQGYVTKPFEADALIEAVRSVMGLDDDSAAEPPGNDPWPEKPR
ncbi:MAG: response regulator [Burkholderiales bacterium]|nr:response regulator [Burkholderiales bacterium]